MSLAAAARAILEGRLLVITGAEHLLDQLPAGRWIGGTNPYFYLEGEPGRLDEHHLMVSDFTDLALDFKIIDLPPVAISQICTQGFENGFHFLILPAFQAIHHDFAAQAPQIPALYQNPLLGFVAGAELQKFEQGKGSKVYNGQNRTAHTHWGVVMYVQLPPGQAARLEIVNDFSSRPDFVLRVFKTDFVVRECEINQEKVNLYEYIQANRLDIRNPLMSNYGGAKINVSFYRLDEHKKEVHFYAPW